MEDLKSRLSSRKFLVSLLALAIVVLDLAPATDVFVVLAPYVGLEGLADAISRWRSVASTSSGDLPQVLGELGDDDDFKPDTSASPITGQRATMFDEKEEPDPEAVSRE